MARQDDLKKLIAESQRRLQKLKEKEARFGLNTPVEVLTEIEDIEVRIDQLQMELENETEPPPQPETPDVPQKPSSSLSFTDGDWITAAIVGPEEAEKVLKKIARELVFVKDKPRDEAINIIEQRVYSTTTELLDRYRRGGQTDEERLNACIAKVVSDILDRELSNFTWEVEERVDEDPLTVFRSVVKAFIKTEEEKWK